MEGEVSPWHKFRILTLSFSFTKQVSPCKLPDIETIKPLQEQNVNIVKRSTTTRSKSTSGTIYIGDLFPISTDQLEQLGAVDRCIFCTTTCWQGKPRSIIKKVNAMVVCAKAFAFSEREIWDRIRIEISRKRAKTTAQLEREQRVIIARRAWESRKRNELPLGKEELYKQALLRTRSILETSQDETVTYHPFRSTALAKRRRLYPCHLPSSWKHEPLRYWNADLYGSACDLDGELLRHVECK